MANRTTPRRSPPKDKDVESVQQTQRLLTWSAYQESLRGVDQKALEQFQLTITSLRTALWVKVSVYVLQLVIVSIILLVSFVYAKETLFKSYWGVGSLIVSLILFVILLFRNPIQSINEILVDLARIQIIIQGFTRQINQLDAVFKQAFLEKKVDMQTINRSLTEIQKIIDQNIENLLQFLEEMQD